MNFVKRSVQSFLFFRYITIRLFFSFFSRRNCSEAIKDVRQVFIDKTLTDLKKRECEARRLAVKIAEIQNEETIARANPRR